MEDILILADSDKELIDRYLDKEKMLLTMHG